MLPPATRPHAAATLAALAALSAVHLVAGRLLFLDTVPRSRALSAAGGVSVAYVFVHVLPEVERAGRSLETEVGMLVDKHVYLVVLAGFVVYYGLERFASRSTGEGEDAPTPLAFWLHLGSFAVYNGLIGYLLVHRETPGLDGLLAFTAAIGLHLVVNDFGLRLHHGEGYRAVGRWVLAVAVVLGAVVGAVTGLDRAAPGALFAFLSGGIVLNTIKEELPAERESRFWAFVAGAAGYAALLTQV